MTTKARSLVGVFAILTFIVASSTALASTDLVGKWVGGEKYGAKKIEFFSDEKCFLDEAPPPFVYERIQRACEWKRLEDGRLRITIKSVGSDKMTFGTLENGVLSVEFKREGSVGFLREGTEEEVAWRQQHESQGTAQKVVNTILSAAKTGQHEKLGGLCEYMSADSDQAVATARTICHLGGGPPPTPAREPNPQSFASTFGPLSVKKMVTKSQFEIDAVLTGELRGQQVELILSIVQQDDGYWYLSSISA